MIATLRHTLLFSRNLHTNFTCTKRRFSSSWHVSDQQLSTVALGASKSRVIWIDVTTDALHIQVKWSEVLDSTSKIHSGASVAPPLELFVGKPQQADALMHTANTSYTWL
jgi:hypothetical protein